MSGDFDKAIDRAVRQMLDVEPPAGLRARVLRRISTADQPASGFSRKILWLGAPVAAAALIVLALLLPQRVEQPAATVVTNQPAGLRPSPAAPVVTPPTPVSPTPPAPRVVAVSRPRLTALPERIVAAASLPPAETTTAIEPLKSITPIEMAPIAAYRVAPSDISVRPLNPIVQLQIAPLSPPDRRH